MPSVKTRTIALHAETAGEGERLLFISGTGGDLRRKPNVFDGPLPDRFEVLAYDQRGLGRSEKPAGPYSMADYADDAAALLEAMDWGSAHVVGVSFGGMVAQEFAIRHPDRLRRLVLCCTSPGGEGGASYPLHEIASMEPVARAKHMIPMSDTRHNAAWAKANPETYEAMIAMAADDPYEDEPGRAEGALRQLEARAGHDTWDRLQSITAPTLICGGLYDGIAPPENQEALANRIPGAELSMFEGGHLFLLQDRGAFQKIIAFLSAP